MALDRGGPGYAWFVSAALLLMVLSPLLRPAGADSFPWSSYPMFGHGLPHALTTVHHLVGIDAAGQRRVIPPALVANDEVLQAEATLRRAVRGGRKTSGDLCKQVAARLADDPAWADIVRLDLLSERYDAIAYFAGDPAPIAPGKLRARCKLIRPGDPPPAAKPQQAKKPKKKRPKKIRRHPTAGKPPTTNLSPGTAPSGPIRPTPDPSPDAMPRPTRSAPDLSPGTATPPAPDLSPGTATRTPK